MPRKRRGAAAGWLATLGLTACVLNAKQPKGPTPEPPAEPPAVDTVTHATRPDSSQPVPNPQPVPRAPAAPAALARLRGWMPLGATGVPAFLAAHPSWDGRGVLIAILDSGIDPGALGLERTSTDRPKLLDLRNFATEGRMALAAVAPSDDSLRIGGLRLAGMRRVRALAAEGPWFVGLLSERALGAPPAADLNDNGSDADTLAVLVVRASDGWVLFADTDGDGSLADERPVHDYLAAHETFGWHRPGAPAPQQIAVNLAAPSGNLASPTLDLVFDTEAHGTHVAGIAAGHGIGGEAGFEGVAPGAQLLGLKISRNDFGGLTTTGSVLAAFDYAVRFAASRRLPLVINMSFGVGNEREGVARLDALLDSALARHPEVVFVTSAGNDGPGLSTLGFPGSMRRAITVGATQPKAFFLPPGRFSAQPDPVLFFSSRGGELAKPDIVAPGTAYSTVPGWNTGEEFKTGTSMASPHAAGLVALLLSGAAAEHRSIVAEDVRRALIGSGRAVPGQSTLDVGAGLPELEAAWQILQSPAPPDDFWVENAQRGEISAAFGPRPDTLVRFRIRRIRGTEPMEVLLHSEQPWLTAPASLRLEGSETIATLRQHAPAAPGTYTGTVLASAPGVSGPLFRLVSTVVVPYEPAAGPVRASSRLAAGAQQRVVFAADSGRPFRVRLASETAGVELIAALHQPGGMPIFGENGIPAGRDTAAASFEVDGRDARSGFYEAVAVAPSGAGASSAIAVDHAPVLLSLATGRDSVAATLTGLDSASGRMRIGGLGVERVLQIGGHGGADVVVPLTLPDWVRHVVVDLELDPAQWPRFTDFGLSVVDSAGRILEKSPANYARSRLSALIPVHGGAFRAVVALAPGFAEPGSTELWSGRLTVRLQADGPVALATREPEEFQLTAKQSITYHASASEIPWPIPDGFRPLGLFLVESGGLEWSWELPLPVPASRP